METGLHLRGKRVLIVEDNFLIAASLCFLLIKNGCLVEGPAFTVAQTMRIVDRHRLDGALLELQLRDGIGIDVARRLRRSGVPFVIVSAHQREHLHSELKDAPYVAKP